MDWACIEMALVEQKEFRWHRFYLSIAEKFSEQSKDPRLKVGCVILTPTGILYPGYNGDEIGGSNEPDSLEPGQSGFIHAEENALIKFDPSVHAGSIMYITYNPCVTCARKIINARSIKRVYYLNMYRDVRGIDILRNAGIEVEKV
jgi:dCMP deaminase